MMRPTLPVSTGLRVGAEVIYRSTPHAPREHGAEHHRQGSPEQVSGGDEQGCGDEAGHGVGHVDDQGAPPQAAGGGHQAQDEPGDHLPPARRAAAQVLAHDEGEPHPAENDDERAGCDGPHHHPCVADEGVQVGKLGGGAGDDVAHGLPAPQLAA